MTNRCVVRVTQSYSELPRLAQTCIRKSYQDFPFWPLSHHLKKERVTDGRTHPLIEMRRRIKKCSWQFLVKMHHFSIGTICLLCTNAQERIRLEYCMTTQKEGLLKIFPMSMILYFLIFASRVRHNTSSMLRLIFFFLP